MSTTKTRKARINASKNGHAAKEALAQQFIQQHAGSKLLGELVCWSGSGFNRTYAEVIQALKDNDLNPKVAREILPRHAFTRATKKLTDDRVIDLLREDSDTITFQFSKRMIENDEWKYGKETFLELNKITGKVSCADFPDLEQLAQKLVEQHIEERNASDITKIVQKLFDQEADLFPVRDQGAVYFVPEIYTGFTDKIEKFLVGLGGRIKRFPIPAGVRNSDKEIQDTVVEGLTNLIKEHESAIDGFSMDTRHDTLTRMGEKIQASRLKLEAYAFYLQDKQEVINEALVEANRKLLAKVESIGEERKNRPVVETDGGGNRAFIFGWSVTAIIRWMGVKGWKFKEVRKVVDSFVGEGKIAEATIRAQLLGGRNGTRGDPAKLSDEQIGELEGRRSPDWQPAEPVVESEVSNEDAVTMVDA